MSWEALGENHRNPDGTHFRLAYLFVSALALGWLYWQFAHTNRTLTERPLQLALYFLAFPLFAGATIMVWRAPSTLSRWLLLPIIIAALAFRLAVAPVRAATTSDIYRYIWEGKVVREGMNPYLYAPDAPELTPLRDWVWPLVQHKSVSAAYPPAAIGVFVLAGLAPLNPVLSLKLVLGLFDVLTVLLLADLLRRLGRPATWVIAYAWHPLIICEVVARGHLDSIGIFFLVLSLRLLLVSSAPGRVLSGAVLSLSILSKGYALFVLLFALLASKPHRRAFALGLATAMLLLYLPFLSAGANLFRGMEAYAQQWSGNASIFALVRLALSPIAADPDRLARLVCAALLAIWLTWLLVTSRRFDSLSEVMRLSLRALVGFFLFAPTVYPWYLAWTVPFLCFEHSLPLLALTGTIFAFYAHDFAGHHAEIWWVTVGEYGLPLLLAVALYMKARRGSDKPSG